MTAPKRRKKNTAQKNRFQNAISAMDRWSLPNFTTEAPIKKYALIVFASAIGGLLVFGGLSALISTNPNKEIANTSHSLKKQATDTSHSKREEKTRHAATAAHERAPNAQKSIDISGSAFVSGSNAAIRERPAINAKILERAVFGSNVELLSQEGKWVQVRSTGQNVSGWIERAYLSF
jgi:outer membrane murein-binding lipoprotein Lpp